jgi:hypothetical protein
MLFRATGLEGEPVHLRGRNHLSFMDNHKKVNARPAGVTGIGDARWIVVALCYIGAIALMGQDPWYGDKYFTYNQGIFVGILAIMIVAGFCWEIYMLGRPGGINLVLHCLLMVPMALLIGRIAGLPPAPEASYGLLGQLKDYAASIKDITGIGAVLPVWLQDIFRNPGILVLIFFTSIAFTQKKPSRRFALVVVAFLVPAMQSITQNPRPSVFFVLGFVALLIGIAVQYSNYGQIISQQNILRRLRPVNDQLEFRCSLRIAKLTVEDGFITEDGVLAIVQREYSRHSSQDPFPVRGIAQAISHRLVREHRVLELHGNERGFFLVPYPAIFKIESFFDEIAVWIRKVIITGIALVWLISPIDLFPDSIPVLGAIDDALISLIGAAQWIDTIKHRKLPGPQ